MSSSDFIRPTLMLLTIRSVEIGRLTSIFFSKPISFFKRKIIKPEKESYVLRTLDNSLAAMATMTQYKV